MKKAVICGVSYKGIEGDELEGCINDAKCMKYLLITKFKFKDSNILMLTDEKSQETCSTKNPTKKNIRKAMKWLIQDCQPGDSLVFFFAGHGTQEEDSDGDEIDGKDETICPSDFRINGNIIDDEINRTIVQPLPSGVTLHAIIDACHSGTVLDLPYLCRMNRHGKYEWEDHRPKTPVQKDTSGGDVFLFSGCDDHQNSSDGAELAEDVLTGAMTYSFFKSIEIGYGATYGCLLNSMRTVINDINNPLRSAGHLPRLLGKLRQRLLRSKYKQEPQLTSNKMFDIYTKPFTL